MYERLSTVQVARHLGISKSTLLRWLRDGLLPEPEIIIIGGLKTRAWAAKDIELARKLASERRRRYGAMRDLLREQDTIRARLLEARAPELPQDRVPAMPVAMEKPLTLDRDRITVEELAELLGISRANMYEWTKPRGRKRDKAQGRDPLPFIREGKRLVFSRAQILDWLNKQQAK